jgi:cytochrome c oxidase assembly protein subunit 15
MVGAALAVVVAGTLVTATGPHAGDTRADRLTWFRLDDIARAHGVLAWCLLASAVVVLALVHRAGAPPDLHARGRALTALVVAQGALGYAQYALGVPPGLVVLHVLGSMLVWIAVLRVHLALWDRTASSRAAPVPGADPVEPVGEPSYGVLR